MPPPENLAKPDAAILNDLVQRILAVVQPLRIILFGSAARNRMGADSDLDVLVVVPDGTHRRDTTLKIYRNMLGLGIAKDIVVATQGDVARNGDNWSMVYFDALRQGRELYHAVP
jgi:uncharacterized protein